MEATGYDVVDLAYCKAHGIAVANIHNYAVHTVPEHAFALILALRRNILAYRQDVENGVWNRSERFCFFTHDIGDLHGATLGIIGEGAIGQGTAAIGRAFGMRVLFADHPPPKMEGVTFTPHEQVLAESDVISLHCPLLPATRNLINLEAFRKMKRNALLINTARGGLVDEAALTQALDEKLIAGAGFDVPTVEPPMNFHPLLDVRRTNFILTPHVAWASDGAMKFLADQLIDNIELWCAGAPVRRCAAASCDLIQPRNALAIDPVLIERGAGLDRRPTAHASIAAWSIQLVQVPMRNPRFPSVL